ncbi:MAG: phosphatidate cytidylyltransferase [Acidobacteria bacterium]|nr:phosphatidate cytidylyltransferase [Acidobacteriota bacterium]
MKRVLTAIALLPLAFYGTFWAPYPVFFGIVAAMAALCFSEYARIVQAHGLPKPGPFGYLAGLVLLANPSAVLLIAVFALALAVRAVAVGAVLPYAGALLLGVLYVFGAWRSAIDLRALGPLWLFFAMAVNWIGDIVAYYVGRALGRHKLSPSISPGKSWEGGAASLVAAVVFGLLAAPYLQLPPAYGGVLAAFGNIAGQIGDLAESAMKRGSGLKDSGTLLPGHGGWLDRLDSTLFSMPVVYYVWAYARSWL